MKQLILGLSFAVTIVSALSCNDNVKVDKLTNKKEIAKDTLHPVTQATENAYASVDISPMDMSYYPIDFPKLKMENNRIDSPVIRVIYSRPHLDGRRLFINVLKYGEPWRLGANESTEIQFYKPVTIQNKLIQAGRYIIYCVPQKDEWNVVLNTNIDSRGLKQDITKDIHHFKIPVSHHNPRLEYLTIVFERKGKGANLIMAWEEELAKLPIDF